MSDDDEFHLCWFVEPIRIHGQRTRGIFYRHSTPLWVLQCSISDLDNIELLEVLRYDKDKGTYSPATEARGIKDLSQKKAADVLRSITAVEFGSEMKETNNV